MDKQLFSSSNFSYKEQVSRSTSWGHRFLFLNIILTCLIGTAYVYAAPETESFIAFCYLLVTWLGHLSFVDFIVYLVILFPLTFIGNFKLYRTLSVIIAVIAQTILLIDAKLFLVVKAHLSLQVIGLMLRDLDFNTGLNYNFLYIAIPLTIIVQCVFARLCTNSLYRSGHSIPYKVVLVAIVVAFLTSHCLHIWSDAVNYEHINALRSVFPAHYPMTARSFLTNHGWLDENSKSADSEDDTAFTYPLQSIEISDTVNNRNVLTIFINGLSYQDLSSEHTPNLWALKQNYHSFENHYLPYDNLRDNIFALTFGLPVEYRSAFSKRNLYPVIADELHRQDYSVRLFTDSYFDLNDRDIVSITGSMKRKDAVKSETRAVISQTLEALEQLPEGRLFAFNINFNTLNDQKLKEPERIQQLNLIDTEIGNFISKLQEQGRANNTIIMISSSAGNPAISKGHDLTFNRERQHVPLIIMWPENYNRGVSEQEVSSIFDLSPTVGQEALGIVNPCAEYSLGCSLKQLTKRDFIPVSRNKQLLLIGANFVTIYTKAGNAYSENYGKQVQVKPNLANLISAMRDLNRFRD